MRLLFNLILLLVVVVAVLVGSLAVNQAPVSVTFLSWETPEISLFWWLLLAFGVGLAVGWVIASYSILKAKLGARSERRQREKVQRELDTLQLAQPETDTPGT
ncbi:MAG: LapA family protein [Pseudomonadota bacterium]